MPIAERLLKPYDPQATEGRIYEQWNAAGAFAPEFKPRSEKVFSMALPPPNVTGALHLGHAAMLAIEDIMVRYARMRGDKTLWLPGTDHAAIATQVKVEELIYKTEGKTRFALGREEFLKRVEAFAAEKHDEIVGQIKKLGASVDWSREAFTLDEARSRAVRAAFKQFYDAGLIYRGRRLVNWDPKLQTTASHDQTDYDLAERHHLDFAPVIDQRGRLLPLAGDLTGQHWKKARPLIIEKLRAKGWLEKIEPNYQHQIAKNSRGGGLIEPQILEQWFVAVNKPFGEKPTTLKELMRQPVADGRIKIIPERFKKVYFHWLDHLRDWCISRQIWYGHRIPVWYQPKAGQPRAGQEVYVGIEPPANGGWTQDPDTLDTWFSSGLWTFSTLGWPDPPNGGLDLKTFHPLTFLETGYDILFFWVARMILMSGFLLDQIPFPIVYLHGLVRDAGGKKMSKSKDNSIDPLTMIAQYGADALRLALIIGTSPGHDLKISEDRIRGYKYFSNKLWNIGRFTLTAIAGAVPVRPAVISAADQTALAELAALTKEVTIDLENYNFHLAAEKLYHYIWHTLADKIIEQVKTEQHSLWLLYTAFERSLRLLHPFSPFITEELWSFLPKAPDATLLINTPWPTP